MKKFLSLLLPLSFAVAAQAETMSITIMVPCNEVDPMVWESDSMSVCARFNPASTEDEVSFCLDVCKNGCTKRCPEVTAPWNEERTIEVPESDLTLKVRVCKSPEPTMDVARCC